MNLVLHTILEIHKVGEVNMEWGQFIVVDMTVDCYGFVHRTVQTFYDMDDWEKVKARGYYMA